MSSGCVLALDVGGSKTEVGLVDPGGRVMSRARRSTAELRLNGRPLVGIAELAETLPGHSEAVACGISLPGPVCARTRRMLSAPTIPELQEVDIGGWFLSRWGRRVEVENDANACALAELRWGSPGLSDLIYITVSTGIGGGAVLGGKIFRGSTGTALEVGHQIVMPSGGPACDCGSIGCLEALASGRGVAKRAGREPDLAGIPHLDAEKITELARTGTESARTVIAETADWLAIGVSNLINLFDPQVVCLGGGFAIGAADLLLPRLRTEVERRCMPSLRRRVEVRMAVLGGNLGLLSAAALVLTPVE